MPRGHDRFQVRRCVQAFTGAGNMARRRKRKNEAFPELAFRSDWRLSVALAAGTAFIGLVLVPIFLAQSPILRPLGSMLTMLCWLFTVVFAAIAMVRYLKQRQSGLRRHTAATSCSALEARAAAPAMGRQRGFRPFGRSIGANLASPFAPAPRARMPGRSMCLIASNGNASKTCAAPSTSRKASVPKSRGLAPMGVSTCTCSRMIPSRARHGDRPVQGLEPAGWRQAGARTARCDGPREGR